MQVAYHCGWKCCFLFMFFVGKCSRTNIDHNILVHTVQVCAEMGNFCVYVTYPIWPCQMLPRVTFPCINWVIIILWFSTCFPWENGWARQFGEQYTSENDAVQTSEQFTIHLLMHNNIMYIFNLFFWTKFTWSSSAREDNEHKGP